MGSAVQQLGRLADAQELRFQAAKCSEMCSAIPKGVDLLMQRNRVFRLRNFPIWAMLS